MFVLFVFIVLVLWQVGSIGVRVGEASHPGPPKYNPLLHVARSLYIAEERYHPERLKGYLQAAREAVPGQAQKAGALTTRQAAWLQTHLAGKFAQLPL